MIDYILGDIGGSTSTHAYKGADASVKSTPQVTITYGTHHGFVPSVNGSALNVDYTKNILTLGTNAKIVYVQIDFKYDGSNTITIIGGQINFSNSSTPPTNSVSPEASGGSGSLYQTLFAVSVSIQGQNASVSVSDNVSGSQDFQLCFASILGPWVI